MLPRRSWSRRARRGPSDAERPPAGLARRDRHAPERGILVTTDGVDGWFEGNLANHAVAARAIEEGDTERASTEEVLGFNRSKLSRRKGGAGRRRGPGDSRSLRKE